MSTEKPISNKNPCDYEQLNSEPSNAKNSDLINNAIKSKKLWKGWRNANGEETATKRSDKSLSTGYSLLDAQLHGGGWPLNTTTELGFADAGIGELRLLMPALRKLQENAHSSADSNIMWIAPPFLPFAPALLKENIDISRLTIVQTRSMQDTLWAAEQALLSKSCAALLTWTGNYNLSTRELRRLQLAAEKSGTWHVLLRGSDCLKQTSSSGLRIHLKLDTYSRLKIHILKQPQGWGGQHCTLSLQPHYENWQRLPVALLPHHNRQQAPSLTMPLSNAHSIDHEQGSVTVLASLAKLKNAH